MSTTTTNYGFIKPALADPADITVTNPNWDAIDSKLKSIDEKTDRLEQDKIVLIEGVDYGEKLPTTGVKGQLFFKKV